MSLRIQFLSMTFKNNMHYYVPKCLQINQVNLTRQQRTRYPCAFAKNNVRLLSYKRVLMTSEKSASSPVK
jgi:hypothetical protein